MARFKNENDKNNPIIDWLLKQGYEYKNSSSSYWSGYQKIYPIDDSYYYVWVTFNFSNNIIYVYKEYDCGGCVGEDVIEIRKEWLGDLNTFIDEVDEKLEYWIG